MKPNADMDSRQWTERLHDTLMTAQRGNADSVLDPIQTKLRAQQEEPA